MGRQLRSYMWVISGLTGVLLGGRVSPLPQSLALESLTFNHSTFNHVAVADQSQSQLTGAIDSPLGWSGIQSLTPSSSASIASIFAVSPLLDEPLHPINLPILSDILLPQYPSFDSQLLDQQIILYTLHLLLSGPPDILIVGSSRAIQGVDPDTLQRSLVERGYPEYEIYNFSINGATAQVIDLLLRRILTTEQLPKLVIWADGSRAFNSGRHDRTYEQIVSSAGFEQLENAMHPILYRTAEDKPEQCQDIPSPYFPITAQAAAIRAIPDSRGLDLSAIADPWADLAAFHGAKSVFSLKQQLPPRTVCPHLRSLQAEVLASDSVNQGTNPDALVIPDAFKSVPSFALNATGFLENFSEFDPTTYYKSYPYVSGEYDADYVPFVLDGEQNQAMLRVVNYLKQQDIPLVVVNLPLTQTYLDPARTHYEALFLDHMQQQARQAGLMFINLNQADLAQDQFFADPSHLNTVGARVVAQQLTLQPMIPWPDLNE